jgi:hypothetical protein
MNPLKHRSRFFAAPGNGQGYNQPKRTNDKSDRGLTEAVAQTPVVLNSIY